MGEYLTQAEWDAMIPSMQRWRVVMLARANNSSYGEAEKQLLATIKEVEDENR